MSSSSEALEQLNKWKSESTKLFMSWSASIAHGWCTGVLTNVPPELHFEIDGIDGRDCLFVFNVHPTYHPRFKFLDTRDGVPFFSPRSGPTRFGKILEISLSVDREGNRKGRVVFAEHFSDEAISV